MERPPNGEHSDRGSEPTAGEVVIGREMGRAIEADERHRRERGDARSPLDGVAYDPSRGEYDLHRFVNSPTDERLHEFVNGYAQLPGERREAVRATLTMDDFYALLTFARRRALETLRRGDTAQARAGLTALTAIDAERVDWRDVSVAAALLAYVLRDEAGARFRDASVQSEPVVAEILQGFAEGPVVNLADWGYRDVAITGGRAFFEDQGERYEPDTDLIALLIRIATVIEDDVYRVSSIGVGHGIPEVWLQGGDRQAISRAVESQVGCAVAEGDLRPDMHPNAQDQQLTVFLAEAASPADATVIATASRVGIGAGHQALGLAAGKLCCVVVARSFVEGVPAFERSGALERFRPALAALLAAVGSG